MLGSSQTTKIFVQPALCYCLVPGPRAKPRSCKSVNNFYFSKAKILRSRSGTSKPDPDPPEPYFRFGVSRIRIKKYIHILRKKASKIFSVADPGWIPDLIFFHPDPGSKRFRIPDPDLDFFPIPDPGSRSQKGTGSQIRIRNTENIFILLQDKLKLLFNFKNFVGFPVVLHYGCVSEQATVKKLISLLNRSTGEVLKAKPR